MESDCRQECAFDHGNKFVEYHVPWAPYVAARRETQGGEALTSAIQWEASLAASIGLRHRLADRVCSVRAGSRVAGWHLLASVAGRHVVEQRGCREMEQNLRIDAMEEFCRLR